MKRRIIIILTIYSVAFLIGGLYILRIIESTTGKLDNLIMLHQVEILREHYLIQIRRVQTNLAVRGTKFAPDHETTIKHIASMDRVIVTCFDCHHAPGVAARIEDLHRDTKAYEGALAHALVDHAGGDWSDGERDRAFQLGEALIAKVSDMIALTGARLEKSTQRALAEIARTKRVLLILLCAGPAVSVALGFLLVRGLSRPLDVLLRATRKLKAGDLDYRVSGLQEEFAELGSALNDMSSALKDHIANLRRAERMAMLGQLSAGLAHEIKNPLAGIKAAMEVLAAESTMPADDKEILRKVQREVERVESLMKTFLNFARPPKPQPANVDINALVSSSLTLYGRGPSGRKEDARITVSTDLRPLPVIATDPMQLEQVLVNLVFNAFEAMPDGGLLTIRTRHDESARRVRIEVADSGKGIAAPNLAKIFEPFFTTKPKGTGLGLAISRQLIEQQGGALSVTSKEGSGTVFTIELPATAVTPTEVAT